MLESGAGGDAEAEMLGDRGHRRHQQQRIGQRDLRGLAQRGGVVAAVDVVGAEHVGDEDAVEPPALQQFRQLGPVGQVLVAVRLIVGMAPQPG